MIVYPAKGVNNYFGITESPVLTPRRSLSHKMLFGRDARPDREPLPNPLPGAHPKHPISLDGGLAVVRRREEWESMSKEERKKETSRERPNRLTFPPEAMIL